MHGNEALARLNGNQKTPAQPAAPTQPAPG